MLDQRRRRWHNIKTALSQRLEFAGQCFSYYLTITLLGVLFVGKLELKGHLCKVSINLFISNVMLSGDVCITVTIGRIFVSDIKIYKKNI